MIRTKPVKDKETEGNAPSVMIYHGWRYDEMKNPERWNSRTEGTFEADGIKTEGLHEADGIYGEGIRYADGARQRFLDNHVWMNKWMTCSPRFG